MDAKRFEPDEATDLVRASDPRWWAGGDDEAQRSFARSALESVGRALAFVADGRPRWVETLATEGVVDWPHVEVLALTGRALLVLTVPWAPGETHPRPSIRIHPLRTARGLEIDGFATGPDGRPAGCTVTLLFVDAGVRLGGALAADRRALAELVPALRDLIVA
ncbi:hypothetical protein [Amnibacterium sp.]|uniref:hypothetical protein n=1 Tax=Amnibacterium sp. TaxID=1872496 RepID=UPI003F7C87B9